MSTRTVVTADLVYASYADEPLRGHAVLVEDGVVRAVDSAQRLAGTDAARLDLGDAVLGPGFVDAHVHLAFDSSDDPVGHVVEADDVTTFDRMRIAANGLVAAGITTARDLGAPGGLDLVVRDEVRTGRCAGPDLLLAGRPLTTPGGHCHFFGGECADAEEMVALVRRQAAAGADWVKLVVSGGFLTDGTVPAEPQFDVASMSRVVTVAHDLGLGVAAHAHSTRAVDAAVRAGVDTLEHATFLAPDGADFDPSVRERILDSGVAVCPTTNVQTSAYPPVSGTQAVERLVGLHADGMPLIAGTDCGVRHVAPYDYVHGLIALTEAGLGRRAALVAATSAAADVLGVNAGSLAPGRRADLVALRDDPLADLTAIADPLLVMARGHVQVETAATPVDEGGA